MGVWTRLYVGLDQRSCLTSGTVTIVGWVTVYWQINRLGTYPTT